MSSANQPARAASEQQQREQRRAPQAQDQAEQAGKLKGSLEELPKDELLSMKNRALYEQAVRGEQPGLMVMQDRLGGQSVENAWGMTATNEEPEKQT
ncbi:hypothetical protein Rsub_08716 [Raphidocelis subcapitata]|uniref:Uncharacterized protein n=1 Tax=Raphidocelis subcapitata TaxID=307507 RepID=A0A2V0P785_9CHLO|nr:hypothetical protein Rsub_08716 [Raphidocelis subcapitata]|eukprot:GBF95734.1 hypothetical protein Rsub_08716 [Raphidocelis subcapitata]